MNYVYGIRFGPYLKVGLSIDPRKRMQQIAGFGDRQQLCPPDFQQYEAEPVFAVPGTLDTERLLKLLLSPHHVVGEWYWCGGVAVAAVLADDDWHTRRVFALPSKQPVEF